MSENRDRLWWVLRIGAAACFVGHGAFGIITKASWLPFFGLVGIGPDVAYKLMPIIGTIDIIAGLSVLVRPMPIVFLYMSVWALWTAALRPLSGGDVAEMLERAGNYGVPLAAVFLVSLPTTLRGWFAVARPHDLDPVLSRRIASTLVLTSSVLLMGHGLLAIGAKPLLVSHHALLGLSGSGGATYGIGWFEVGLAVLVLAYPSTRVLAFVFAWKLASEALFLAAGDPVWEFIERGGSYAAPLGLLVIATIYRLPRLQLGHVTLLAQTE